MSSETIYSYHSIQHYTVPDECDSMSITLEDLQQKLLDYKQNNPRDKVIKDKVLRQQIIDFPLGDLTDLPIKQKISAILLDYTELPKCECGGELEWLSKRKPPDKHGTVYGGWREFCSQLCMQKSPTTIDRRRQTNKILYGAESWAQSEEGRKIISEKLLNRTDEEKQLANEKSQATSLERYGVTHYSKTEEYLERREATVLDQTDGKFTNWFQDVDRIRESNLNTYGVDHYNKTPEGRDRQRKSCAMLRAEISYKSQLTRMLNLYTDQILVHLLIEKDADKIKNHILSIMQDNGFEYRQELAAHLGISQRHVNAIMLKYGMRDMYLNHGKGKSYKEKEVYDFVVSLGVNVINSDKKLLGGREIDMVCPDQKLGIEFDGMYYHSVLNGKDRDYHVDKTDKMEAQGYQLLHIFESEWDDPIKQEIWKSIIKAKLGIYDHRVYARKCSLVQVDSKNAREFFTDNHLAGFIPAQHYYGLEYEGEIVSMISFGVSRFSRNENEIYRFASLKGHSVVGAFGKFVSNLKLQGYVSFADRRFSGPDCVYSKFFSKVKAYPPSWWGMEVGVYDPKHRLNFTKQKLKSLLPNYDDSRSAIDNMLDNGYDMIYDCGNWKFYN